MAIREISGDELTLLRTEGQFSKLYLAGTETPPTVFSCRINQTFTTTDKISEFLYTLVSGDYLDVLPNMEVWVGSAEGTYDIGQARVRKAWTDTTAYIGEESELALEDALYITVKNTMGIWAKHVYIDPATDIVYMDNDIPFTDEHIIFDPVPIMGSDVVVDLDNIDLTELVTNGTFNTVTTGWTAGAGVLLTVVSAALHINRNGAGTIDHAYQDITTVIGMVYAFSVNIVSYSHSYEVYVDGVLKFDTSYSTGVKSVLFTATSTTTRIAFRALGNSNATLNVDDVSVKSSSILINFDSSDSYVYDSTISAKLWTTTAGVLTGATTNTPTLAVSSYPSNGLIRVSLRLTTAAGAIFTAYRYVRVYYSVIPAFTDFTLDECGGELDSGGFSFGVTLHDNAQITAIRDRAQITLFATDYYGNTKVSIGQQSGRENIIASGWVDGESIVYNAKEGSVSFTVQGPHFWIDKIAGFPNGLRIATNTPDAWTVMPALTVDRALWHLFHWRSTIVSVCDVRLTGDTRYAYELPAASASLWQQIKEIAYTSIFAIPGCDQYGRMFVNVHPQLTPETDRTWETVQTVLEQDWQEKIDIKRWDIPELAMLSSSGIAVNSGGGGRAYFSLSNGHVFKHYGDIEIIEKLLLTDQAQSNVLCGLMMGFRNNQYPEISIRLAQNNRMFTLFPQQFAHLDLVENDTVRGIVESLNLIVKSITYQFDPDSGFLSTDLSCEAETFPELAVDGDIPGVITNDDVVDPPTDDIIDVLIDPPILPPNVFNDAQPKIVVIASSNFGVFYTETFDAPQEDYDYVEWIAMNDGFPPELFIAIKNLVVTPSGAVFIKTNAKVYAAPYLGGIFTEIANATDDFNNGAITGIAINPNENEEIVITGSLHVNSVPKGRFVFADSGGLGDGAGEDKMRMHTNEQGIVYANNKWYVVGNADAVFLDSTYWYFTSGGALQNGDLGTFCVGAPGAAPQVALIGTGTQDIFYYWYMQTGGGHAWKCTVAGDMSLIFADVLTLVPNSIQAIATSPTGNILMAGSWDGVNNYTVPYKSIDGGTTWTSVAGTIPVGADVFESCRDDYRFLMAGGTVMRLTMDVGTTYIDKSGNLPYIAPLIDIINCRFVE